VLRGINLHFINLVCVKQRRESMKSQSGFTLIELVVVIVVLGILAAVAVPKFINVKSDAQRASINGLAGGLRAAAALAKAQYLVTGNYSATSVTMDGAAVTVTAGAANGYPTSAEAGIGAALSYDGFTATYTATTATFVPEGFTGTSCQAVYTGSNGTVAVTDTGC
jgi:MSHA pilin protein MshA